MGRHGISLDRLQLSAAVCGLIPRTSFVSALSERDLQAQISDIRARSGGVLPESIHQLIAHTEPGFIPDIKHSLCRVGNMEVGREGFVACSRADPWRCRP